LCAKLALLQACPRSVVVHAGHLLSTIYEGCFILEIVFYVAIEK